MATNLGDNERCRKLEKVWENALALHDNQAKALKVQHDFRAHCQQMLKDFDTKGDGSSEQRSQLQDSVDKAEKSVKEAQESVKEAQKSVDNALAEWKEAMDLVRAQANVSSATESVIIAKPAASERQDSQDPGQDPGQESYASESVRQSPVHQPLTTWQSKITTATNIAEFLMVSFGFLARGDRVYERVEDSAAQLVPGDHPGRLQVAVLGKGGLRRRQTTETKIRRLEERAAGRNV